MNENQFSGKIHVTVSEGVFAAAREDLYLLAKKDGFTGPLSEFIASLKGERGEQGIQGERGERGERGEQGIPGERGADGRDADPAEIEAVKREIEAIKQDIAALKQAGGADSDGGSTEPAPKPVPPESGGGTQTPPESGGGTQTPPESGGGTQTPPAAAKATEIITFGDSTMALIDEQMAKAMNGITVNRRAVGGTLLQHAMMEAGALDIGITFDESPIPAYVDNKTTVSATLQYPDEVININGFWFTVEGAGSNTFNIIGQNTAVKVLPNRNNKTPAEVQTGRRYDVLPAKGRNYPVAPVVAATCKNNINGAPEVRTAPVLAFCKTQTRLFDARLKTMSGGRVVWCTQWKDNVAAYKAPNKAQLMQDYNDFLREEYGETLFDLEAYVMSGEIWTDTGIEPSEEDREAQRQKLLPMGLARDAGAHLKTEANAAVARKIQAHLQRLGWI